MNALIRYWHNFARYVKHGHAQPLPLVLQRIPIESWAERKRDYERAQISHHGRGEASAALHKATFDRLVRGVLDKFEKEDRALISLIESHPWLFSRDPVAFDAAIKAIARWRLEEARR